MNKSFVEDLIKLIQENPDMEVLCMVDSEIVADDGYLWWPGVIDDTKPPEIREYSTNINGESFTFKDDLPYEYWEDFMRNKVDEVAKWKKAIFIKVTVGDTV